MKILFVIETIDNHNGTSVSAKRFAEELKNRGHEVRFLTTGIPDADRFVVPEFHLPLFDRMVQRHGFKYAKKMRMLSERHWNGAMWRIAICLSGWKLQQNEWQTKWGNPVQRPFMCNPKM